MISHTSAYTHTAAYRSVDHMVSCVEKVGHREINTLTFLPFLILRPFSSRSFPHPTPLLLSLLSSSYAPSPLAPFLILCPLSSLSSHHPTPPLVSLLLSSSYAPSRLSPPLFILRPLSSLSSSLHPTPPLVSLLLSSSYAPSRLSPPLFILRPLSSFSIPHPKPPLPSSPLLSSPHPSPPGGMGEMCFRVNGMDRWRRG